MAVCADYSFELISIETYAPQFIGHNKLFLGSVIQDWNSKVILRYYSLLVWIIYVLPFLIDVPHWNTIVNFAMYEVVTISSYIWTW